MKKADRDAQRLALHASGMTDEQIGARVGRTPNMIRLWRKGHGLPPNLPPPKEPAPVVSPHAERDVQIVIAYKRGDMLREIAALFSLSRQRVQQVVRKAGCTIRPAGRRPADAHNAAQEARVREAHAEGLTDDQIAERVGLSLDMARRVRCRLRLAQNLPPDDPEVVERNQQIREAWAAGGTTYPALAKKYGISRSRVYQILAGGRLSERNASRDTEIRRLYHDERLSGSDIASRFGLSPRAVFHITGPRRASKPTHITGKKKESIP